MSKHKESFMARELRPKVDDEEAVYGVFIDTDHGPNQTKVRLFNGDFTKTRTGVFPRHQEPLGIIYLVATDCLHAAFNAGSLKGSNTAALSRKPISRLLRSCTAHEEEFKETSCV
jgi:hypothetical protein